MINFKAFDAFPFYFAGAVYFTNKISDLRDIFLNH